MNLQTLIEEKGLKLVSCEPTDFLDEAIDMIVSRKKNAIAVIGPEGKVVGILTDHDIMRAVHSQQSSANNIYSQHVFDWMTDGVITAPPDTSISVALNLMGKHHIRHLVVTDDGKPIAIVSIRDILRKLYDENALENSILRDIAIAARASVAA